MIQVTRKNYAKSNKEIIYLGTHIYTYENRNFAISFKKRVNPFICQNGYAAKVTIWGNGLIGYGCGIESTDTRLLLICVFAIGF